jgi:hypothetical protein
LTATTRVIEERRSRTERASRDRRRQDGRTGDRGWAGRPGDGYDNLPGLPFPASPDTYPGKDDVAGYLQGYAAKFRPPVRHATKVTSLTRSDGVYLAKAGEDDAEFLAERIVSLQP